MPVTPASNAIQPFGIPLFPSYISLVGARFSPSGNTSFYAAGYTLFTLATRLTALIYY
ncbi:BnaC01g43320D [Brassica napus]|uniref:BnaC01g43320D protein n=1 Tax=Brassica napus TaxID=3708 RepID=A0A078IHD5_BRANA|nr:BnaC01g43320D [Brassica napus]